MAKTYPINPPAARREFEKQAALIRSGMITTLILFFCAWRMAIFYFPGLALAGPDGVKHDLF